MNKEAELVPLHGTLVEKNEIALDELADRIRELLARIQEKSGADILEVGELLRLARLDFPGNSNYGVWCSANFAEQPQRTLYNYCQLAEHFYGRPQLFEEIPQSGLQLLSQPKCDDFREDAIAELRESEAKITYKAVEKVIRDHMPVKADLKLPEWLMAEFEAVVESWQVDIFSPSTGNVLAFIEDAAEQGCIVWRGGTHHEEFAHLREFATSMCFLAGKIDCSDGSIIPGPIIFYWGGKDATFNARFAGLGVII